MGSVFVMMACRGVSRNKKGHKVDRLTPAALVPARVRPFGPPQTFSGALSYPPRLSCPWGTDTGGDARYFVLSFPDLVRGLTAELVVFQTLEEWDGGAPRVVPIPNSSTLEATFDIHFEEKKKKKPPKKDVQQLIGPEEAGTRDTLYGVRAHLRNTTEYTYLALPNKFWFRSNYQVMSVP
ncbi:hypothetical protein MCOR02_002958 [Pyricularia oryzae]|uniref:Uncharacterized protein n=1 Tax=Pyricularia grisea TaxID=148305 RepID=A0ABQ8NWP3_PYRGI|nr:hypothetical protein MCOR02_002958 [Pyricularia oryzae]KAI6303126.1 hypothetical protein MCOR33_001721 [Pyricularia grisea]KAI6270798.1 hypothetical protein MCOR26_008090 [Pyricularia oryzae]KAI6345763.1 hypothetical protein MCOR28_003427 [Pyricularia oryzae]KAI6377830.1 hypothetical protein MCOR31_001034 [Pyricularia oryzae]